VPVGNSWSPVHQAVIDAEGRLVIVGNRLTQDGWDFTIARMWL